MSRAVCTNCGAIKQGAWAPCPECGVQFLDIDVGLAISEYCLPFSDLQSISQAVWTIRNSGWDSDRRLRLLVYYLCRKWPGLLGPDIRKAYVAESGKEKELEEFYQARLADLPGPEGGPASSHSGPACPHCGGSLERGLARDAGVAPAGDSLDLSEKPGSAGTAAAMETERPHPGPDLRAPEAGADGETDRADQDTGSAPETREFHDWSMNHRIRPWVRLAAKIVDLHLFNLFCAALLPFVPWEVLFAVFQAPLYLVMLLALFLWVLAEPILLATWGTTPGRWLFNTEVRDRAGERLTYMAGLKRSFRVWRFGLAFGIPLWNLVTMYRSYQRLMEHKVAPWDEELGILVIHGDMSLERGLLAGSAIAVLLLLLLVWTL